MIFLVLLPMLFACGTASMSSNDYTLKSVHVVLRHGISVLSTPENYIDDLDDAQEFNPHSFSVLTNAGKMGAYKFGQFLRSRYSDFLGEECVREDIYARSSYLERARASLLLVLAGLYPPNPKERWHASLNWQPISIESPPDANDTLMWAIDCPAYRWERTAIEASPDFQSSMKQLTDFFIAEANYTESEQRFSDLELQELYTKLRIEIPDWAEFYPDIVPKITRNAAILRYHAQNYNAELRRLNGGMLLKKIFDDMKAVTKGQKMPKINLYGGQGFNIVALLWGLDAWKPIIPTYSSAVIVEFYQKFSHFYVKVLYHDGLTGETESRDISGCVGNNMKMCPFDQLVKLRRENVAVNENQCYDVCNDKIRCYNKYTVDKREEFMIF